MFLSTDILCSRTARNTPSVLKSRQTLARLARIPPVAQPVLTKATQSSEPSNSGTRNRHRLSTSRARNVAGTLLEGPPWHAFAMRRRFSFDMGTLSASVRNLRKKESSESSNVSPIPAFHELSLTLDVLVWTANVQRDINHGSDHVTRKVEVARVHRMAANPTNARLPFRSRRLDAGHLVSTSQARLTQRETSAALLGCRLAWHAAFGLNSRNKNLWSSRSKRLRTFMVGMVFVFLLSVKCSHVRWPGRSQHHTTAKRKQTGWLEHWPRARRE